MGLLSRRRPRAGIYSLNQARRRSLVAAGATPETDPSKDPYERLHQDWQARVFGFYHTMGECWNPGNFTARAMSKIRLYPAVRNQDGEEVELTDGWAFDLVAAWQQIPEPYGRLKSLIGEGRLCQYRDEGSRDTGTVRWDFLSPIELRRDRDGRKILRRHGGSDIIYTDISRDGGGDPQPGEMRMWRLWRPDPENSGMADSGFRGVNELYTQLWWHTLAERAELRNRAINAGLLLIPEEIEFETPGAEDQAMDDDPEVDPFNELLFQVMTAALQNPGSAEAVAPPVIRGPAEYLKDDVFRLMKLHDPASSLYLTGREDALMKRISIGLDMPNEAFMGLGSLNHWNAWKSDDEKFQYVSVEIAALLDDLTDIILRPVGIASNQRDAADVYVGADVAELVSDPDKGKTAIELRRLNVIGAEATRAANDFEDTDAPTPEEHEEWLAIQLRSPELLGIDTAGGSAPADDDGQDPGQNEEPPVDDGTDGEGSQGQAARFAVAATTTARAHTATWLRSRRRSCPECLERTSGVPDSDLTAALGPDGLKALGVTVEQIAVRQRDAFWRALDNFGCAAPIETAIRVEEYFAGMVFTPVSEEGERLPDDIVRAITT